MSDKRSKPGAVWAILVLAIPLIYPLAFGPASWLVDRGYLADGHVGRIYKPIVRVLREDSWAGRAATWYVELGATSGGRYITMLRLQDAAKVTPYNNGPSFEYDHDKPFQSHRPNAEVEWETSP